MEGTEEGHISDTVVGNRREAEEQRMTTGGTRREQSRGTQMRDIEEKKEGHRGYTEGPDEGQKGTQKGHRMNIEYRGETTKFKTLYSLYLCVLLSH